MDDKTKEIQKWWNDNPFTLGVATGDYRKRDLVGRIAEEKMNAEYFTEIDRRFRKHSGWGGQAENEPLLSKLVDYSLLKDRLVLDIATGSGIFAVAFASGGADVVAIDLTDYAVKQTEKNFKTRGLKGKVIQMDAQNLDFPNDSFDFVNAWGCLMHMPDTEKAISEIFRVLKPGGTALAYMYNKSSWPFWFNIIFLRGVLLGGLVRYRGDLTRLTSRWSDGASEGGNMLTKFYTPNEARNMFQGAGFSEAESFPWDIGYEPDHWPARRAPIFKYLPKAVKAWMAKRWGYGLIVKAKK